MLLPRCQMCCTGEAKYFRELAWRNIQNNMALSTVTILGATGLVGSHLAACLQQEKEVERIKVLVRRPVQFREFKVETKLVNFADLESIKLAMEGSDAVFCASTLR